MEGISEESLNKVKGVLEHMCPVDIEDDPASFPNPAIAHYFDKNSVVYIAAENQD